MGVSDCPFCGALYPLHGMGCPLTEKETGPGGNPIGLLAAPFVVLAIPFIVVVFPIASIIAILVSMGVYWGISQVLQDTAAFWLTLLISLIPFLAALNAEQWAERFRGYRIGRHLLRVGGVSWLAAEYLIYWPGLMGPSHRAASLPFAQFIAQILSRPGVLGTMIVLAIITHLAGSSFDLNGARPGSWGQFFKPRRGIFFKPEQSATQAGSARSAAESVPKAPLELSRKLMISSSLGFAIGIAATIIGKDYDSVVMVILRVGVLCAVVFGAIVVAHHVLTRKAGSNRAMKVEDR